MRNITAVTLHDEQAGLFQRRYTSLARDPYSSTFNYGRKKIQALLIDQLAELESQSRVVDVGCGTGFDIWRLNAMGFKVTGIEPSHEMRTIAQEDNPTSTILPGDARNLPLNDESADAVIAIEVLRYLENPLPVLTEMARVLRPGGKLFVTAAPLWSLNGYALVNWITSRIEIPTFVGLRQYFATSRRLRDEALAAGFNSAEVHGLFFGPWHVLGRIAPATLGACLRRWEPFDDRTSRLRWLANFSNHLVLCATR
jgi:SAM-dependent methyltransferase